MRSLVTLALLAVFVMSACAKNSAPQTASSSNSPQSSIQQATVNTNQGKVTMGQGAVDPNSLGLPVYPGAQPSEAGSFSVTSQQGSSQIVTIVTKDPYDKVVAFYKAKMPAGTQVAITGSGTGAKAQFVQAKTGDKVQKSVIIAPAGDSVNITMIVGNSQ